MTYRAPLREIGVIAIGAFALYVFLAVASYSPTDSSLSFSNESDEVHNLVGMSGAYLSNILLTTFGLVAYGFPIVFVLLGVHILRRESSDYVWTEVVVGSVGWVVITISACVLIQLHIVSDLDLPVSSGGVLGQWSSDVAIPFLGVIGLTLLGIAGMMAGIQASIGFSWLNVLKLMCHYLNGFVSVIVGTAVRPIRSLRNGRSTKVSSQTRVKVKQRQPAKEKTQKRKQSQPPIEVRPVEQKQQKLPSIEASSASELPGINLLDDDTPNAKPGSSKEALGAISRLLELKLKDFGVDAEVVSILPGPVVTRFEVQPAAGVKVQKISSLAKDLARSLAVINVRIVEVISGKSVVGIEIPNECHEIVRLKELFKSSVYESAKSPLSIALGRDISGVPIIADITRMPHLLIAGTTGSGKSVGVHAMLLSILYKASPEVVRLILVDPKMLELSAYEGIPHLLAPVVTEMKQATHALNWCIAEMERRYRLMVALGVRNIAGLNRQVRIAAKKGKPIPDPLWESSGDFAEDKAPVLKTLPFIVVVIDEFADMMMIVGKKVEQLIARLAQKARAAGIHLVLATQRPSVDIITGLIKANIPARMSFQVPSKVDSRTILDQGGAEQLLGYGDLLFLPPGTSVPIRVHGAFVSDEEVNRMASHWKKKGEPAYSDELLTIDVHDAFMQIEDDSDSTETEDPL